MNLSKGSPDWTDKAVTAVLFLAFLYLFLLSIQTMGYGFKFFGKGFAEGLIRTTSSPTLALFIGLLATSLTQSSSSTTSIIVTLVAGGALNLHNAIPMIMGANIGTTITNTMVSLGHISHRDDFRRAYASSVVHDVFNVLSVAILLPLQYKFNYLEQASLYLTDMVSTGGGLKFASPLKFITDPVAGAVSGFLGHNPVLILTVSLAGLFVALKYMVKYMKILIMARAEVVFEKVIFRTQYHGFVFGIILTTLVQSSSVTTSLIVPLAGAGMLSIDRIFPYTLGANIGTTVTAMLAALATANPAAISVAFAHLMFNVSGILLFWWIPFVPIKIAEWVAAMASKRRWIAFVYILVLFFVIPAIMVWIFE